MAHPAKEARDNAQDKWPGATVSARAKKSITHQHPSDSHRFMFDTTIGPMHYGADEDQEIDTAWQVGTAPWDYEMVKAGYNAFALEDFSSGQIIKYVHPDSGEDIAFQPQQLQYTNDLDQIQAIADPQSVIASVQNEDELFWTGAYGTGFDLRWQCQTARLDKRLFVDQALRFPAVQQFIIDGGNPVLRLQFIFQVSNGIDIYVNDVLWNRNPNNPAVTAGYVDFRSNITGETIWTFNLPRSRQQEPPEDEETDDRTLLGTFRLRRVGPNLFVEHLIPVDWIQNARYPIEIDINIDKTVAASSDDAIENAIDSSVSITDTRVICGDMSGESAQYSSGYRWTGISGLSGATIDLARITWQAAASDNGAFVANFRIEDAAAPATFTTDSNNVLGRSVTATIVSGDSGDVGSWTNNQTFSYEGDGSTDLKALVQDVATAYDPTAIVILWIWASGGGERIADSYDGSTTDAPKLHIEYTAANGAVDPIAQIIQIPGTTKTIPSRDFIVRL